MSSYGIFRVSKLKTMGNLKGSLKHALREQLTLNADPSKLHENILLTPDTPNVQAVMDKYEHLKPEKIRNDQVRAIEVLVTASPNAMAEMSKDEQIEYLKRSLAFANNEFGENNLLHAQIHEDETTAHLTAFYIPRIAKMTKKGEKITLNAKELLGNKKEFSDRQTRFYESVAKDYGFERGEMGSKAVHQKISDYYRNVNKFGGELQKAIEYIEGLEEACQEIAEFVREMLLQINLMIPVNYSHYSEDFRKKVDKFRETEGFLYNILNKRKGDFNIEDFDISKFPLDRAEFILELREKEEEYHQLRAKFAPPQRITTPKMGMR